MTARIRLIAMQVTAELFLILLKRLSSLPLITLKQLTQLSGGLKSDLQQMLDEITTNKNMDAEEFLNSIEMYRNLALKKRTPLGKMTKHTR